MALKIGSGRAGRFHKVHVEISNACNLKCGFCPEVARPKKLMDPALFERVIEQLAPLTEQVAFHLMGEPLAHPRLGDLVGICERHSVRIFLVTNGTLLREGVGGILLRPAFRQVNFSLHSFPENFPERDPTEYLERIFSWTERALRERPDLYVNFRLWNLSDPRGTGERNREILRRIGERFGPLRELAVDVRRRKSVPVVGRLYLHFDTEFTWPALDLPLLGETGTCYGLSSHFGILADGTVVPCCLDKEGAIPLGNARDAPLVEILAGPRAQRMLNGFRRGRLEEELCRRCRYIERFS